MSAVVVKSGGWLGGDVRCTCKQVPSPVIPADDCPLHSGVLVECEACGETFPPADNWIGGFAVEVAIHRHVKASPKCRRGPS